MMMMMMPMPMPMLMTSFDVHSNGKTAAMLDAPHGLIRGILMSVTHRSWR
jgi:hypothetical protein